MMSDFISEQENDLDDAGMVGRVTIFFSYHTTKAKIVVYYFGFYNVKFYKFFSIVAN
jgi:hypothetical protein